MQNILKNKFIVSIVILQLQLQLLAEVASAASGRNDLLKLNLSNGAKVNILLSDKKITAKFHSKKIDRLIKTDKILAAHLLRTDVRTLTLMTP